MSCTPFWGDEPEGFQLYFEVELFCHFGRPPLLVELQGSHGIVQVCVCYICVVVQAQSLPDILVQLLHLGVCCCLLCENVIALLK